MESVVEEKSDQEKPVDRERVCNILTCSFKPRSIWVILLMLNSLT